MIEVYLGDGQWCPITEAAYASGRYRDALAFMRRMGGWDE